MSNNRKVSYSDDIVPEKDLEAIKEAFPFDEMWEGQAGIIYQVIKAYLEGKKFAVLSLGTGTGKSVIGMTIANIINAREPSTRIITKTRVLQKQYEDSFDDVNILWGKRHYSTIDHTYKGTVHRCSKACPGMPDQHQLKDCPWYKAKIDYLSSPIGVTNNAMYLASPLFRTSGLLIVDECHNIIDDLIERSTIKISSRGLLNLIEEYELGYVVISEDADGNPLEEPIIRGVKTDYLDKCEEYESKFNEGIIYGDNISGHIKNLSRFAKNKIVPMLNDVLKEYTALADLYPTKSNLLAVDRLEARISRLITNHQLVEGINQESCCIEMLYHYEEDRVVGSEIVATMYEPYKSVSEAVSSSNFSVYMSATTGDYEILCKSLNLDPNRGIYVEAPVPFDIKNRPVYICDIAKVNYRNINSLLSVDGSIHKEIVKILEKYPNYRGLIHTVSYRNANEILRSMKESNGGLSNRLVIPPSGTQITEEYLRELPEDAVLMSPSMTEGVDLKNDLARFQIIMKIPFGYLGDNYIKSKSENDPDWYLDQTGKVVTQMVGRVCRSSTDWGHTYVFDSSYKRIREFLPKWLTDAEISNGGNDNE